MLIHAVGWTRLFGLHGSSGLPTRRHWKVGTLHFPDQAGLAKRHNTLEFLMAMHLNAGFAEGEQADLLDALVKQAITRVLGG